MTFCLFVGGVLQHTCWRQETNYKNLFSPSTAEVPEELNIDL